MKNYYKRYLVLAIIGAAIIGLAFYLLLNSYLDKEEIVVASKDLPVGTIINDEDLEYREYYKNSLPEGYVIDGKEIVGGIINIDRRKHDYISSDMFEIREDEDDFSNLETGEAVIAIEVSGRARLIISWLPETTSIILLAISASLESLLSSGAKLLTNSCILPSGKTASMHWT